MGCPAATHERTRSSLESSNREHSANARSAISEQGMNTDVLIIGAGCGGLDTAIQLRQQARDLVITLVNPTPYLLYRPWLIYLPAQRRSFEALQVSLQKAAAAYQLRLITDTVTRLDLAQHQAWLGEGEPISYRSVLLATGAPADRERLRALAAAASMG